MTIFGNFEMPLLMVYDMTCYLTNDQQCNYINDINTIICVCLGTDPEDVIRNAFACFDEEGVGHIHEDRYTYIV